MSLHRSSRCRGLTDDGGGGGGDDRGCLLPDVCCVLGTVLRALHAASLE